MQERRDRMRALGAFTATSYPVLVNEYLVGDYGILIFIGAAIGAALVERLLRSGMDEAQEAGAADSEVPPPAAAPAPR